MDGRDASCQPLGRWVSGGLIALLAAICVGISVVPHDSSAYIASDAASAGHIAWMLCSSALVLLMTPGVVFFYAGMVRHKNVVATMVQALIPMAIIPLLWATIGFSLAFGDDTGHPGLIGNPATYGLWRNVGAAPNPTLEATTPLVLFATFQLMFAIVAPSLIVGSIAERMNFSALCIFLSLWHLVVYAPLAHMTWHPSGILHRYGILDFAGGTVVHMASGWSALAAAWFLGPPSKEAASGQQARDPANVPFVVLGTTLLWFGWIGFNGGSARAANAIAATAVINTTFAAASAMLTWVLLDNLRGLKCRATGLCFGAVAGMVTVTSGAGYVDLGAAGVLGILGALVACGTQWLLKHLGSKSLDDNLDVFAVHGMGGTISVIATACCARQQINPSIAGGAFSGNAALLGTTLLSVLVLIPWLGISTLLCLYVTSWVTVVRVSSEAEEMGLDVAQHGERAVNMELSAITGRHYKPSGPTPVTPPVSTGRAPTTIPGWGRSHDGPRGQEHAKQAIPGWNGAPSPTAATAQRQQRPNSGPRALALALPGCSSDGALESPRFKAYRATASSQSTESSGPADLSATF